MHTGCSISAIILIIPTQLLQKKMIEKKESLQSLYTMMPQAIQWSLTTWLKWQPKIKKLYRIPSTPIELVLIHWFSLRSAPCQSTEPLTSDSTARVSARHPVCSPQLLILWCFSVRRILSALPDKLSLPALVMSPVSPWVISQVTTRCLCSTPGTLQHQR